MNKIRVLFFFGLLVIVILIARHNSRQLGATARISPTPTPPSSTSVTQPAPTAPPQLAKQSPSTTPPPGPVAAGPPVDFSKVAAHVASAVVLISAFDAAGNLLHSGSGCFVSGDGRIITTSEIVRGAAHAVAKVSDGRILDVAGILSDAPQLDLSVLKADTKRGVPSVAPNKSVQIEAGAPIAVVGSTLSRRQPNYFARNVATRGSDTGSEWLGLSAAVPGDCVGAPSINDRGELIGIVTSEHPQGAPANAVRPAAAMDSLLARINPRTGPTWQVAGNTTSPPGEGPTAAPARTARISVVQADQPGTSKLIYSPKPKYPLDARHPTGVRGEGRYRIRFAANGQVQDVQILESTHNATLDSAATETLRKWKAAPGREWTATVPISFQP